MTQLVLDFALWIWVPKSRMTWREADQVQVVETPGHWTRCEPVEDD